MIFEELMHEAKWLEAERPKINTRLNAAETMEQYYKELSISEPVYDSFANLIETLWKYNSITNHEFNLLALTAFYDYPDGLKPDPEFDI